MSASTFTPSSLTHEQLEALLTARQGLADDLFARIRDGVESGTRRCLLLVGPRGIGKTFLVSLLHHRVLAEKALEDKLATAWLSEDPYSISSYVTLLREILTRLDMAEGVPGWKDLLVEVKKASDEDTRRALLEDALVGFLGERGLFLIAENLNDILEKALGEIGQKQLRSLLQSKVTTFLLCSTTSMVPAINDRDAAFHGFFDIRELHPFTFEECVETLINLAQARGNKEAVSLLQTAKGRARVRAIHHLAGGNPRVYTIFYDFLTMETLDEVKAPFIELVDKSLTPYYQSRMQTLSPRQCQYIDVLRRGAIPMAVKDIAGEALAPPNSVSKELARLKDLGYVTAIPTGRESLYELREPLMRICLAVKEERGDTIPLLVDFLRVWFIEEGAADITPSLGRLLLNESRYKQALKQALEDFNDKVGDTLARIRNEDIGNDEKLIKLRALFHKAPGDRRVWKDYQELLQTCKRWQELIEETSVLIDRSPDNAFLWDNLAFFHEQLANIPAMIEASNRALEESPDNAYLRLNHLFRLERHQPFEARKFAKASLDAIEEQDEGEDKSTSSTRNWKRLEYACLKVLGRYEESLDRNLDYIEADWSDYGPWRDLLVVLQHLKSESPFLSISELCTELFPEDSRSWRDHAVGLVDINRHEDARSALQRAIQAKPALDDSEYQLLQFTIDVDAGNLEGARKRQAPVVDELLINNKPWGAGFRVALDFLDGEIEKVGRDVAKIIGWHFKHEDQARAGTSLPLARFTDSEATLRTAARIWRTAYREHIDGLSHLGKNLLRYTLNPWTQLSDEQLSKWCEIWEEVTADNPEMDIPLRLMRVAVDFRKTRNKEALIGLRKEERLLLDEPIRRYLRGLGLELDPILEKVEAFVTRVRAEAEKKKKEESRQAQLRRWTQWFHVPVPEAAAELPDAILDAALATYHARAKVSGPLPPLIPGPWRAVAKKETRKWMKRLALISKNAAKFVRREDCRILRLDTCPLEFSPGSLFQLHLNTPGGIAALDFWGDDEEAVVLTGRSPVFHDLVQRGKIRLDDQSAAAYIAFFASSIRGESGRFQVIRPDDEAALKTLKAADFDGTTASRPDGFEVEIEGKPAPDLESLIVYDLHPFWAAFRISDQASGAVEMINDKPLNDKPLAMPWEIFAGPLRLWAPVETETVK